jgi:hypothetical protein
MRKTALPFLLLCTILLSSCASRLEKDEYIRWVTSYENGLHVSRKVSEYIFDLQYQPAEFRAAISGNISSTKEDLQYYVLTIGLQDGKDLIRYQSQDEVTKQQLLYYYAYRFQQDITLEDDGGSKQQCVFFHFEQNDLKGQRTFILGFPNSAHESQDAKLAIQSSQFGSLPIRIKISKQNIPALKL